MRVQRIQAPKVRRRTLDQVVVSPRDYRYLQKKRTGRAALRSVKWGGEILATAALYDIARDRKDFTRAAGGEPPYEGRHRVHGYKGRHRR
jgi:hypothetical protein